MLNHIVIMGRLSREPELCTTQSGVNVASFTVAVDRDFAGRDGNERQTDFFDCSAWRSTGEFVSRYFHKGSMIAVQGSIQTRNYEDKNGNRRTAVEIVADRVSFCGSKSESNTGTRYDNAPAPAFSSGSESTFSVLPDDDDTDYSFDGGASDDGLPF